MLPLDVYTLAQPDGGTLLAQIDQQQPFIIPTISDEYDLQQTKIETLRGLIDLPFVLQEMVKFGCLVFLWKIQGLGFWLIP